MADTSSRAIIRTRRISRKLRAPRRKIVDAAFKAGKDQTQLSEITPRGLGPILPIDELIRLGEAAVIELERRGYDVRGKTAKQIKKILRFPPPKREAKH